LCRAHPPLQAQGTLPEPISARPAVTSFPGGPSRVGGSTLSRSNRYSLGEHPCAADDARRGLQKKRPQPSLLSSLAVRTRSEACLRNLQVLDAGQVLYDVLAVGIPRIDAVSEMGANGLSPSFFLMELEVGHCGIYLSVTDRGSRLAGIAILAGRLENLRSASAAPTGLGSGIGTSAPASGSRTSHWHIL
jgi:hypothetical protein